MVARSQFLLCSSCLAGNRRMQERHRRAFPEWELPLLTGGLKDAGRHRADWQNLSVWVS